MSVFELLVFKIVLVQVPPACPFMHNIFRNFFDVVKLMDNMSDIYRRNQENGKQNDQHCQSPKRIFKLPCRLKNHSY